MTSEYVDFSVLEAEKTKPILSLTGQFIPQGSQFAISYHNWGKTWFVEKHPDICKRLVYLSQQLPDDPDFVLYRLLAGLAEAINTCF